jgi:hypothetical protein
MTSKDSDAGRVQQAQAIAALEKMLREDLIAEKHRAQVWARYKFIKFQAYRNEGFTEQQALALVKD